MPATGRERKPARKPRGTPYRCERCQKEHAPAAEILTPWEQQTPAEREQDRARYLYKQHRDYAEGTEAALAIKRLREWIKPGDTLYTVLRSRSRSGMMRHISLLGIEAGKGTEPAALSDFSWNAARALGWGMDRDDGGVKVSGCGLDTGFHLVEQLACVLFPDGFGCIGEKCPSNDHANGDRDRTPHPGCGKPDKRGARDHWHQSGGYAVRQRWL